jgi:hypothetical protein
MQEEASATHKDVGIDSSASRDSIRSAFHGIALLVFNDK